MKKCIFCGIGELEHHVEKSFLEKFIFLCSSLIFSKQNKLNFAIGNKLIPKALKFSSKYFPKNILYKMSQCLFCMCLLYSEILILYSHIWPYNGLLSTCQLPHPIALLLLFTVALACCPYPACCPCQLPLFFSIPINAEFWIQFDS